MDSGWSASHVYVFFGRVTAGFIFSFLLSWTHIWSFCVHSSMHAGTHSAFWMCVCGGVCLFFWCCRVYDLHSKHAWLYLKYIFLFMFIVRSWLQYNHLIFEKFCFWVGLIRGWQWKCFKAFSFFCFCFRLVPSTWGEPGRSVAEASWGQRGEKLAFINY